MKIEKHLMRFRTRIAKAVLLPLGWIAIACHAQTAGAESPPMQSQASFEAAFRTISTSPQYVLMTAVDDKTGQARTFCTLSSFLLGAIDREGVGPAVAVARASRDHVFHFRQQAALDNIRPDYSADDLAAVRERFATMSTEALAERYSRVYGPPMLPRNRYPRGAVACALIERGLSPHMEDLSGEVAIDRQPSRQSAR